MKTYCLLGLFVPALLWVSLPATAGAAPSAERHYVFDVSREGSPIGTHEVRLRRDGDATRALIDTRLRVRFLGLTVYRLDYASKEVWNGDKLQSLRVEVNHNGERLSLEGQRRDEVFEVTDGGGERRLPLPLVPTNHWHPIILEQQRVLNTLTGKLNDITVKRLGEEVLTLASATVAATRYRFVGELRLDSWYDGDRWLGMDFEAQDGSIIEYRCRNCTGPDGSGRGAGRDGGSRDG